LGNHLARDVELGAFLDLLGELWGTGGDDVLRQLLPIAIKPEPSLTCINGDEEPSAEAPIDTADAEQAGGHGFVGGFLGLRRGLRLGAFTVQEPFDDSVLELPDRLCACLYVLRVLLL